MDIQIEKFLTTQVVYYGSGSLSKLPDEIRKHGAQKIAVVTDPGVAGAGILDRIAGAVEGDTSHFTETQPEPPVQCVDRCVEFLKHNACDMVIGLGGGSSLDTAKMAAVLVHNPGSASDYFGADRLPKAGIPVIAIPTTAGTGSETTPAAVFVDATDKVKKGVRSDFLMPVGAILDPDLTLSLPQPLTASTGIDALTHAVESYTARHATFMSDIVAERSIKLVGEHLRKAYAVPSDIKARTGMILASYLGGIALTMANVGAVHALAHTAGGMYHQSHGLLNALFLPYVMTFNRIGCREKFVKIASFLGERVADLSPEEASRRAVDAVFSLNADLDIPRKLRDLEMPKNCIDAVPEQCLKTQGRILTNNARLLSLSEARQIVENAY